MNERNIESSVWKFQIKLNLQQIDNSNAEIVNTNISEFDNLKIAIWFMLKQC